MNDEASERTREERLLSELITVTDAAQRAGVSVVTLRKIIRQRGITIYRNPRDARERLVDAGEIDAAMQPTPLNEQLKKATGWVSSHAA